MTAKEYADIAYEKIGKANLNNVLKISDEIKDNGFDEFVSELIEKCNNNAFNNWKKCDCMTKIVKKYCDLYHSDFNYNKQMIVDNFLMELCSAMRSI